ncbi:hypothetical protein [Providencia sp. PROV111]|uniref:hypothetical protein n=1 Tax=Providencia sp. PROV111 TaxID=2949822 RepID=UPI00234B3F90|nr:hypothetical protein [Providencia sp. PROV111]
MLTSYRIWILAGMLLPATGLAETTTRITATIVASSCQGVIATNGQRGTTGMIDFGVINPKMRAVPVENFSLILTEYDGGDIGCSAFEVYARTNAFATITFGDLSNHQLDARGVVTRYDDGSVSPLRVRVTPVDPEARFMTTDGPGFITQSHRDVQYPVDFATRGKFDFQASLDGVDEAKAGKFSGTLTLTLIYR